MDSSYDKAGVCRAFEAGQVVLCTLQAVWSCQDQPVSALGRLGSLTLCEAPHRSWPVSLLLAALAYKGRSQGLCLKEDLSGGPLRACS